MYYTFYNKISGRSLDQWLPRYLDTCRHLIYNALIETASRETNYVNGQLVYEEWIFHHIDFDSFCILSFMDDCAMPTGRPGDSRTRRLNLSQDIQRAFYSGYLRKHGLKAQVVYLLIGIVASVFITELRQNDNGVQNMSGLHNYLLSIFERHRIWVNGLCPCLFADAIFRLLGTILPRNLRPSPDQQLLMQVLSSLRQSIEHVLGDVRNRFRLFSIPRFLSLMNRGPQTRRLCLVTFLIHNCYNCINGSRCEYFGFIPPSLEEYLPLDEIMDPPPAVDLGHVWHYGNQY